MIINNIMLYFGGNDALKQVMNPENNEDLLAYIENNVNIANEISLLSDEAKETMVTKLWPDQTNAPSNDTLKVLLVHFLDVIDEKTQTQLIQWIQNNRQIDQKVWQTQMKDLLEHTTSLHPEALNTLNSVLELRVDRVAAENLRVEQSLRNMRFLLLSEYVQILSDAGSKSKYNTAIKFIYSMTLYGEKNDFATVEEYVSEVENELLLPIIHSLFGPRLGPRISSELPNKGFTMALKQMNLEPTKYVAALQDGRELTHYLQWTILFSSYFYGVGCAKNAEMGWSGLFTAAEAGNEGALKALIHLRYTVKEVENRKRCFDLLVKRANEQVMSNFLAEFYTRHFGSLDNEEKKSVLIHFTTNKEHFAKVDNALQEQLLLSSTLDPILVGSPEFKGLFKLFVEIRKSPPHELFLFLKSNWSALGTPCHNEPAVTALLKQGSSAPLDIKNLAPYVFLMTQLQITLSKEAYKEFRHTGDVLKTIHQASHFCNQQGKK